MAWQDPTGLSWLRWLDASWPAGRPFGVGVRIHVTTLFVPLIAAWELGSWGVFSPGQVALLTAASTVGLYVVIWTHEMDHILAAGRYRIPTRTITLSPLGGLAHLQAPAPSPRADIFIALAGPATHLAWLAIVWPLGLAWRPEGMVGAFLLHRLLDLNLGLLLFNLLPFFPMDGGRVLRSLLAFKLHPSHASLRAAQVGIVGAAILFFLGVWRGHLEGGILLMIGVTNFFACRREIQLARFGEGPYGAPRQPWEGDPEAWKTGPAGDEGQALRPSLLERLKAHRAAENAERHPEIERARFQAELDRLLQRVSQVGLAGLTEDEHRALARASDALRAAPRKPGSR